MSWKALNSFISSICLNLVKINCFLGVYQYNFIKFQSSNTPSCQNFWTGFLIHVCTYNIVLYNIQYYFHFFLTKFRVISTDVFPPEGCLQQNESSFSYIFFLNTSYTLFLENFKSVFYGRLSNKRSFFTKKKSSFKYFS